MKMVALIGFAALALTGGAARGFELVEAPELGLRLAKGFTVTRYADDALAPGVYSMTLDPAGQVVVSSRGYIKRLLDTDGDGRADKDEPIAKSKAGAMGMLFLDETTLLTTEGGAFNRYTDADGDGKIDAKPEKIAQFGGGEHGAHALRRGADRQIYMIGGNDAKFDGHEMIRGSDRIEGGALLRWDANLKKATPVSHGFRNPYDFDISTTGAVYCYDSDCEREFPLPWYSPTRLYEIEIGGHHGWRLKGWKRGYKRPDYYTDSVEPMVNVGRGSPTGVAVYRHGAFPQRFYDGVFYADWTFGKIYFTQPGDALLEFGEPKAEVFLESTGTNGFAPTDIVVAPDGSMFISMGGRGTSGSVFHVRATQPKPGAKAAPADPPDPGDILPSGFRSGARAEISPEDEAKMQADFLDGGLLEDDADTRLATLRKLMIALGDWNLHKPSKELFTAYELAEGWVFEERHEELLMSCRAAVRPLLHSLDDDERREAARLLAMLRDPHPITASRLLDAISKETDPTEDFHYLTCLARVEAPLGKAKTLKAAWAILDLDGKFAGKHLRSKQTYPDRLNELVASLAEHADIYESMQIAKLFTPGNVGLLRGFPNSDRYELARRLAVAMMGDDPNAGWNADAIDMVGTLIDPSGIGFPGVRDILRHYSSNPLLAAACAKSLARVPEETDRELFLRTGTLAGLEKLEPRADAENLLPLFRSADEKRALKLIARAAAQDFANRKAAETWLEKEKPEVAAALGLRAGKGDWKKAAAEAAKLDGDAGRGGVLFAQRACATCHAADSALGPALAGAAKRLSAKDLFKAIAEPNADVPEAYRATVFTLADGTTQVGRVAFTSADGVILQTATGTVRLDEGDIVKQEQWARSLMPEGLLDGLSGDQLADLRAYLQQL